MVKKEFLACSSRTIKQVCLPVWEAAFFTFVSGVLVGESASLLNFVDEIVIYLLLNLLDAKISFI